MPRQPLLVSKGCFKQTMRLLIANFEPSLPEERRADVELLYRRAFSDVVQWTPAVDGPPPLPQDDLLEKAINWLIDHREDRGMPRVAELRAVLDPMIERDRVERESVAFLARQRQLEAEAQKRGRQRRGE